MQTRYDTAAGPDGLTAGPGDPPDGGPRPAAPGAGGPLRGEVPRT